MLQPTAPLGRRRRRLAIAGAVTWIAGLVLIVGLAAAGRQPFIAVDASAEPAASPAAAGSDAPDDQPQPNARVSVVHGPMGVTVGLGSVWVVTLADLRLRRIDPGTDSVTAVMDLPSVLPAATATPAATAAPLATASGETPFSTIAAGTSPAGHDLLPIVAVGAGSVWVLGVPAANVVIRLDAASGDVLGTIRLPAAGTGIVSGA